MSELLPNQNTSTPSYEVPKIAPSVNGAPDLNDVYAENKQSGGLRDAVTTAAGIPFLDSVVSAASSIAGSIGNLANDIKSLVSDPRYLIYTALLQAYKPSKISGFGTQSFLGKVTEGISNIVSAANQMDSVSSLISAIKGDDPQSGVEPNQRFQPQSLGSGNAAKFYTEFQKLNYGDEYYKTPKFKNFSEKNLTYWSDKYGDLTAPFQGYKNIYGFSLDSSHLWDISIQPYLGSENNNTTYLDNPPGEPVNGTEYFIPALDYNLSDAEVRTENIPTSQGTPGISIPMFYSRMNSLNMTITDNEMGQWYEYFRTQSLKLANPTSMCAAPYKHTVYQINIYVLNPGANIRYLRKLLCILDGHRMELVGTRDPAVVNYALPFNVVGELAE